MVKGRAVFAKTFNQKINHSRTIDGLVVWNGLIQSTKVSSWKSEIGNMNHLTMNLDSKFSV